MTICDTQRLEIYIVIECGIERELSSDLFNAKYLDGPISRSTLNEVQKKITETGYVKSISNAGRPDI